MEPADDYGELLLGKRLLEKGLIDARQLREAIAERTRGASRGEAPRLGDILIAKGYLDPDRFKALLEEAPPASKVDLPPPSEPAPEVLSRLGKYALLKELGRGGMGVVYEALDTQLNRKVALKLMLDRPGFDEARFVREAQLCAKLKHPHIQTVYEAGVLEGQRYCAMERIEGRDFSEWRASGNVTLRQAVAVLRDAAVAVHAAHEQGVLHRDLKPSNMLVGSRRNVFVTDFGLAGALGQKDDPPLPAGMVAGTAAYMSPEQAEGSGEIDWRSDVYALGAMLYEVLAGRPPHEGKTPAEILQKVVCDPVIPPSKAAGDGLPIGADEALEEVCLRALAKKSRDRYVTAKAMADELSRWLEGGRAGPAAVRPRKSSRRPILIGAVAGGILALTLVGVVVWSLLRAREVKVPPPAVPVAVSGVSPVSKAAGIDPWNDAVDLLVLPDPALDAVEGIWSRKEGSLVSDRSEFSRLEIPYELPEEYDLRVEFSRTGGTGGVRVLLASASRVASSLENDRFYLLEVHVRAGQIRALLDGRELPQERTEGPEWGLRTPGRVGLGSHGSPTTFRRLGIRSVKGTGKPVEDREPLHLAAPRLVPRNLRPGLAGEYFHGAHFEVPALRRIDPELDFGWGEAAAWPGGAPDAFSARWTGWLQVPLSGLYTFLAQGDDGIRVRLDGVQVVAGAATDPTSPPQVACELAKGYHSLEVEYFDEAYMASVSLSWMRDHDPSARVIEPSRLFHDPATFEVRDPAAPPGLLAVLSGHTNAVTSVAVGPDGKTLLTGSKDRTVRLWNADEGKEVRTLGGNALGILDVALGSGGRLIAAGGYAKVVRLWDAQTGAELLPLEGHSVFVHSVAFDPEGVRLVTGSFDGSFRVWDLATSTSLRSVTGNAGGVTCVRFDPEGKRIASGGVDRTLRLWDAETGKELRAMAGHADWVETLAFHPDGKILASGGWDATIRLWETETGKELRVLRGHRSEVMALVFSPDGKLLASGGNDSIIRLWNVEEGKETGLRAGHSGPVLTLAFSPDGRRLYSGSFDKTIRVWTVGE